MRRYIACGLLLAMSFHVQARNAQGPGTHGQGAASSSASAGSQGRYSLGDEYQPWPQEEMKQYAKPKFEPYKGE